MLASVSALTVLSRARVGHEADELAAQKLDKAAPIGQLSWLILTGALIYFLRVAWRLALFALLPFPFIAFAFSRISAHIHQASKDSLECFGKLIDHVQVPLTGMHTLRALGLKERNAAVPGNGLRLMGVGR